MASVPHLQMIGITKRFPGVVALDGVDFDLRGGEVHALVGENGAGKSTLMKILNGALRAEAGQILLDGRPVSISSPAAAAHLGIGMIYQELCLAPHLTAGENIFLGREPMRGGLVDFAHLHADAQRYLDQLQSGVRSRQRVADLGLAQQQMVEIAKALSRHARFLVMDEPTASLSEAEAARLFDLLGTLREQGVGIAYISHRLEEVMEIGDRVTVLRDGQRVASKPVADTNLAELVRLMVGREIKQVYPPRQATPGEELLRVEHLSRPPHLHDISFTLRAGEILGLAGLVGAGRTELVRALFGADLGVSGQVSIAEQPVVVRSPQQAVEAGLALLPEDRKRDGLALGLPVRANITLANLASVLKAGLISFAAERQVAGELAARVDVRAASLDQPVRSLSGGNQQKVVVAKWLLTRARVFFFDEPTQGIDVAAKAEVYRLLDQLAQQGAGIIFISSYLPELLALSDRVLVMCRGRVTGELSREEATQERVLELAALGR
ncbi:MAG: sugar ABC transporter ATP-binding protein [Armatimonadetes bacterium]|nr:sugar ABC transporter ATP-binding protein [Armatimonadota bacterium]